MIKTLRSRAEAALIVMMVCISSLVFYSNSAHAASAFDNAYESIDVLRVGQDHFYNSLTCPESTNLAYDWSSYITDPSMQLVSGYDSDYEDLRESFLLARASGSYGISQSLDVTGVAGQYMKTVLVYWTEDGDAELDWISYGSPTRYGVDFTSAGGKIHFAHIGNEAAMIGSGGCKIGWGYPDTTNYSSLSSLYNYVSNDSWISQPSGGYYASINLFVKGITANYPTSYEGKTITARSPMAAYVAMGDSFSSGEGVAPFEPGTDHTGTHPNGCHRSPLAYPRLLQTDTNLDLGPTAFVACSSATTNNVRFDMSGPGQWDEPAQLDALSGDTEVVTLTIGGNDVDFGGYVIDCITVLCGYGTTPYNDMMARISDPDFKEDLEDTYKTILDGAENADVYVLDYPYLADPTNTDGFLCATPADLSGAVSVQMALNTVIADAVDDVQAVSVDYTNRLTYMPTNYIGSPFEGHHLCTDDPGGTSFNGINGLPNTEYSFHPNAQGQHDYYEVMEDYLS